MWHEKWPRLTPNTQTSFTSLEMPSKARRWFWDLWGVGQWKWILKPVWKALHEMMTALLEIAQSLELKENMKVQIRKIRNPGGIQLSDVWIRVSFLIWKMALARVMMGESHLGSKAASRNLSVSILTIHSLVHLPLFSRLDNNCAKTMSWKSKKWTKVSWVLSKSRSKR